MILHLDTTQTNKITVVLSNGDQEIDRTEKENAFGSQVVLPTIEELLTKHRLTAIDLDGITVNEGPGSFTGTRVGAAVANALAYALKIPVNGRLPPKQIAQPLYET